MAKNTTPALPVWIQDVTLEDIARRSGHAINVYVHGYWGDVITIYVRREIDFAAYRAVGRTAGSAEELPASWQVTMSHSSGGRDTGEIKDDVEAEANFAQGIMAAVQHARVIRSRAEELEKLYQVFAAENQRKLEEKAEAARREHEARIAADTPLGEEAAKQLVELTISATTRRVSNSIQVVAMGGAIQSPVEAKMGADGTVRFFRSGVAISRTKLVELLAQSSNRTQAFAA